MTRRLVELRAQLKELVMRLVEEGSVSNDEIIKEFRRTRPNTINAASRELEDIALRRMINDLIARRKRIPKMPRSEDMFGTPPQTPELFSIREKSGGAKRTKFGKVDLDRLIEAFSQQPKSSEDEDRDSFLQWLIRLRRETTGKGLSYDDALKKWLSKKRKSNK